MADLSTRFLGIHLRNPLIAGSCSLTGNPETIKELERHGIGAVVLKSLFEEQAMLDANQQLNQADSNGLIYTEQSENLDYTDYHIKEKQLTDYLTLISQVKEQTLLPIFGSINCITDKEWPVLAQKIEKAGADGLELNFSFLQPASPGKTAPDSKEMAVIVSNICQAVSIPVTVKLSPYNHHPAALAQALLTAGAKGLILFNRYYTPDIDIDNLKLTSGKPYSNPDEYYQSLRWTGLLSNRFTGEISASSGIHSGETVVKMLLAGAKTCQVVSALYTNGFGIIPQMLAAIEQWMDTKGFQHISQFGGLLSHQHTKDTAAFERIQFMRYYMKG